jgi:hypothetical protein
MAATFETCLRARYGVNVGAFFVRGGSCDPWLAIPIVCYFVCLRLDLQRVVLTADSWKSSDGWKLSDSLKLFSLPDAHSL